MSTENNPNLRVHSGSIKPISQLIDCANRELALRRKHYPGWIDTWKMTREKAEHELECMKQILEVLELRKTCEEITEEIKYRTLKGMRIAHGTEP